MVYDLICTDVSGRVKSKLFCRKYIDRKITLKLSDIHHKNGITKGAIWKRCGFCASIELITNRYAFINQNNGLLVALYMKLKKVHV